ncbi:MAG: hypothetical protein H7836_12900 [Magnetococcus sp. YQC-3]
MTHKIYKPLILFRLMVFRSKKGNLFLIGFLLFSFFVLASLGFIQVGSLMDYQSVYKANWGHIECVQSADYDVNYARYLSQETLFKCNDYTNECKIDIEQTPRFDSIEASHNYLFQSWSYQVCDINGNNCAPSLKITPNIVAGEYRFLTTIPVGKSIKFSSALPTLRDHFLVHKLAKSFYIRGVENGKVFVSESCVLSPDLRGKTLSGGLGELTKTGANSRQNYVIDFVQVATQTYLYSGQEVICQSRQLYAVDNKPFLNNEIVKLQGNLVKSVECCPHEANCNPDTFKFSVSTPLRGCSYDYECANGGNPIAVTAISYVKYQCVNSQCIKSSEIQTECTNTQACINKHGVNSVCDMSFVNFGKCIQNTKPNYCGDGVCNSLDGENGQVCPSDCSLIIKKGLAWWQWVLIIVGFLVFYRFLRPTIRRVPLVGRYLP